MILNRILRSLSMWFYERNLSATPYRDCGRLWDRLTPATMAGWILNGFELHFWIIFHVVLRGESVGYPLPGLWAVVGTLEVSHDGRLDSTRV